MLPGPIAAHLTEFGTWDVSLRLLGRWSRSPVGDWGLHATVTARGGAFQSHGPAATVTTRTGLTERGQTAEARVGAPRRPAVDVTLRRAVRTGGRGARRAKPR